MGIEIRSLTNDQENRNVREFINTPSGIIEIYEPTLDDIQTIIDLQRENGFNFEDSYVAFDEMTVLKKVFPLLTNIDVGNLPDEELMKILENPSVHLLIAKQVVAQIISEANKLYAERVKTEILQSESMLAQIELLNTIPNAIVDRAKRDGKLKELQEEVIKKGKELEEAMAKVSQDEQGDDVESKPEKSILIDKEYKEEKEIDTENEEV